MFLGICRSLLMVFSGALISPALFADEAPPAPETNRPPADVWFTNHFTWPQFVPTQAVAAARFENLHADGASGRLKIFWSPAQMDTNAVVTIFASADTPGHWPVRDWREFETIERGTNWEAKVPVDDIDVPVAYFARETCNGKTNQSPLRLAYPRELGLEGPTRFFWPFIEGFEEGAASWRLAAADVGTMKLSPEAKNGRAALQVTLPATKRSVAVGTTRVRGWRALHAGINGLSVWLRTRGGSATVRFTLHENALTTNQVVSVSPLESRFNDTWQRVDISFESFPNLTLAKVDWLTLEFIADGPREILVDDLQFLGPWKLDPE